MHDFKELKVWQKSMDLCESTYATTSTYPSEEKFNLISQTNRAVVSIPANIAEGAGRRTKPDFQRFLYIASGSSSELETLIILASKLNFISKENSKALVLEISAVQKMLRGLINSLT